MPIKSNPSSNVARPLVDSHEAGRPAKGFKQVVARLAKPFVGFGSGKDLPLRAPAEKHAPSPQMLAQAREQADSFIARNFPSSNTNSGVLSPHFSSVESCQLKLLEIKQLILDIEDQLNVLRGQLSSSSASDQENVLQIGDELLKLEKALNDAKALKTDYSARLEVAFAAQHAKIQNEIVGFQSQMATSSGSKQLQLRELVAQARLEKLSLEIAREAL